MATRVTQIVSPRAEDSRAVAPGTGAAKAEGMRLCVIALLAAACSPVNARPDPSDLDGGSLPDASVDDAAATPDAEPASGPVTVRVVSFGRPIEGADVVFHDADGTPIATAATTADGRATHEAPRGGMVTALLSDGFAHTITDIRPGDVLEAIDERYWFDVVSPPKNFATVPVNPPNTSVLLVLTGCLPLEVPAGQTFEVTAQPGCDRSSDGRFPLLALALNSSRVPLASTELALVDWGDGNPHDPIFSQWNSVTTGSYTVASIPVAFERAVTQLDMLEAGVRMPLQAEDTHDNEILNGTVTAKTVVPSAIGDAFVDRIVLHGAHDAAADATPYNAFVHRGAGPLSGTFDLGDKALPLLAIPTVDLVDGARPLVRFVPPADATLDGGWAEWRWTRNASGLVSRWTIRFPPGATSVRYPALPELFADRRPSTSFGAPALENLALVDLGAGGWTELRQTTPPFRLDELTPAASSDWRITGVHDGD
jgi:hypothetical protein